MKVLVDTCIWSLALRRSAKKQADEVHALQSLIEDNRVAMIGPVRQELLSGIRDVRQFDALRARLDSFPDRMITSQDYVTAASFFNTCRQLGIQGSNTDFLICAVAVANKLPIFTKDKDFILFSKHLPIRLYA
jgi:predicted nucleic acid-binding protein